MNAYLDKIGSKAIGNGGFAGRKSDSYLSPRLGGEIFL